MFYAGETRLQPCAIHACLIWRPCAVFSVSDMRLKYSKCEIANLYPLTCFVLCIIRAKSKPKTYSLRKMSHS